MRKSAKAAIAGLSLCAVFLTGCDDPNYDDNNGIDTDHQVDDSRGSDLKDEPTESEQTPTQDQ